MLKIKIFAVAAFLLFAACAFLLSNPKTLAQSNTIAESRDGILGKIAGYKTWNQVRKPEKKSENAVTNDVLSISNSSAAG